mgnify:CR=1 FL=1
MNKKNLFFFIIFINFIFVTEVVASQISCKYEIKGSEFSEKFILRQEYEGSRNLTLITNDKDLKLSEDKILLKEDGSCPSVSVFYGIGLGKIIYPNQTLCQMSEVLYPYYCTSDILGIPTTEEDESENNFVEKKQAALVKKTSSLCEYKSEKNGPSFYISINNPVEEDSFKNFVFPANKVDNLYYYVVGSHKEYLKPKGKYFFIKDQQIFCPSYIYLEKKLSFHITVGYRWTYMIVGKSNKNDQNKTEIENPIPGNNDENHDIIEDIPQPSDNVDCNGIFANEFGEYLKQIYNLLKFAVPILILLYAIIDFIKALAAQDDSELKKAANKLVKRLIIGVLIFVLPTILEIFLDLAGVQFGVCDLGT